MQGPQPTNQPAFTVCQHPVAFSMFTHDRESKNVGASAAYPCPLWMIGALLALDQREEAKGTQTVLKDERLRGTDSRFPMDARLEVAWERFVCTSIAYCS